jgi:hypothetical protein
MLLYVCVCVCVFGSVNEFGGACSGCVGEERHIQGFVGET